MFDILHRRIPKEKLLMDKRVTHIQTTETGIHWTCADKSEYEVIW
jgi:hypothetical protein